ncbi:MAG TPA: PPOX class F420-dependent oxidoreductase [Candidatus Methylomirabilis sp.]|nr:PPOX class F420-dependent oxidoreductase [Candidatus Methylomirabilis sp.]
MSATVPETHKDLFNKKAFGSFTTLMPDGSPQTTPVWVDFQDGKVLVNTALGRQKDKNVRHDPRVAITLIDPENPYRYLEIRGRVDEITENGAAEHIHKMAKKYLGVDKYPYGQPGEKRELLKITPQKFSTMG